MKNKLSIGVFGVLACVFTGCVCGTCEKTQAAPPPVVSTDKASDKASQVHPAKIDPRSEKKAEKKPVPVSQIAVKKELPPPPPQAAPRKPVPEKKLPPTAHVPNQHRRRPPTWRAFTRLSREEQLKLLELQRSDPDQFKKILQSKADEIYKQEATRKKELDQLTEKIKSSKDPVEKERLKKVLRTKLKEDFQLRLNDTRKDIDAYKRHTARLEAELQKREKNCDAIVDAILNRRLTEKNAPRPGNKPEKK